MYQTLKFEGKTYQVELKKKMQNYRYESQDDGKEARLLNRWFM